MVAISSELIQRYDRPGPRYTSYPPVPRWSAGENEPAWNELLTSIDRPSALYVHVPFCRSQCVYCGCNMVVSRRQSAGDRYLDAIDLQVDTLPPLALRWVHLGGGTPTWLTPRQLDRLFTIIGRAGYLHSRAEISVEVDPMVTSEEHLDALARAGTTRLSVGVQSLDPEVLAAVDRPQRVEAIASLVSRARQFGISSINLDLMTGLPLQTPTTLRATLDKVLTWRPDRLSIFGYAHVPWLKRHQEAIDAEALPNPNERSELRLVVHRALVDAGYQAIGFDHYARRGDALSMALRTGDLGRNFMGYTPYRGIPVVALGPSAISEFEGRFLQLEPHLGRWWRAVETGRTPVVRSYTSTMTDRINASIIERILCQGAVSEEDILDRFGRLPDTWDESHVRLDPLISDGLVERSLGRIRITERGRFFSRVVAMAFDPELRREAGKERYSQAV